MKINIFRDNTSLSNYLVDEIESITKISLSKQEHAFFILCGGKTPIKLYRKLSRSLLPWDRITLTTSDEHVLPENDERRNDIVIQKFLLANKAKKANFHSLLAQFHTNNGLNNFISQAADVLILGMGISGHIAGIFPDAIEKNDLLYGSKILCQVNSNLAKTVRVSFNLKSLLQARNKFLYITGEEKLNILISALETNDFEQMPVCALFNQTKILWAPNEGKS